MMTDTNKLAEPIDGFYRVRVRNDFAPVKEGAALIEGKVFGFKVGWEADAGTLYEGEWAMLPVDYENWPHESMIAWVASGDLEYVGGASEPLAKLRGE